MKTLRVGSIGESVKSLQILLKQKGYNIVADGIFGNGTENAVLAFQRSSFLTTDGIVGKSTWNALLEKDSDVVTTSSNKINDTKYVLTTKNYYNVPHIKKNIVLHHTNGWVVRKGTKDKPSMNHFHWWASTDKHVSTAFSIDYKGNIYQHFDPHAWAYHLGLGRSRNYLDKQSIGIEITNEGFLEKKEDGSFVWFSGKIELPYNRPNDKPVHIKGGWRGYEWYAPYSEEQVKSTKWLVNYLCEEYNIKRNIITDNEYHAEILSGKFEGIYTHANVRDYPSSRNKWDTSPAFPLKELKKSIDKK